MRGKILIARYFPEFSGEIMAAPIYRERPSPWLNCLKNLSLIRCGKGFQVAQGQAI